MWGKIVTEATFEANFNTQFPNTKTDVLIHLAQWQYWWWFWFSFLWVLYYLFLARTLRFRTLKFRPKIVSSFRPHGKWGDLIICILPVSWCANILINSNFLLKLLEWQAESSLFTIRIRGKQWYWVYKFDFKNFSDIISTPKNIGNNKWMFSFFGDLKTSDNYLHIIQMRAQNKWIKKYWTKNLSKFEQEEKNNINFIHDFFKIDNNDILNNNIGLKKDNSTYISEKSISPSFLQQNYGNTSTIKGLNKSHLNFLNKKINKTNLLLFSKNKNLTNPFLTKHLKKWSSQLDGSQVNNNLFRKLLFNHQEWFNKLIGIKPNNLITSFNKGAMKFELFFTKTKITMIKKTNLLEDPANIMDIFKPKLIVLKIPPFADFLKLKKVLKINFMTSSYTTSFTDFYFIYKSPLSSGISFNNIIDTNINNNTKSIKQPIKNYNTIYFNKKITKAKLTTLSNRLNSIILSDITTLLPINVNNIKSTLSNFETISENLLYSGLLEDDFNGIKFTKYNYRTFSVAEESNRITKQLFGKTQPVILVKIPVANNLLKTNNFKLFKLRFFDQNSTVSTRNMVKVPYFVFKQVRYKRRKLAFATAHILTDNLGNEKTIKKNFSLNNQYSVEQDVKNPARYYRMFKKNRFRGENMPVVVAKRLLRVKRTLVIPTHINITAITNSYDVVHSWFIPGLGLKMDCVPGRSTHHTFYVDNAGFYYGQCAEICGRYHHHMPIRVCALPFEHFLIWWHSIGLPKLMYPNKKHNMLKNYTIRKFVW